MAKVPHRPEDIFSEYIADYQKAFGEDLEAITLFGSAARGDYIRGRSDINFLVVLSEKAMERLDLLAALVDKWKKRKVATPLFMTAVGLSSSVDSYPIEFLNMQRHYQTIYGKDLLSELVFQYNDVRLQCERELKGKSLLLLQRYLETAGNAKKVQGLISDSITAFLAIFKALLYLKGVAIPGKRRELIQDMALHYGIDAEIFFKCLDVKEGVVNSTKEGIKGLFRGYLKEVRRLADRVDQLPLK